MTRARPLWATVTAPTIAAAGRCLCSQREETLISAEVGGNKAESPPATSLGLRIPTAEPVKNSCWRAAPLLWTVFQLQRLTSWPHFLALEHAGFVLDLRDGEGPTPGERGGGPPRRTLQPHGGTLYTLYKGHKQVPSSWTDSHRFLLNVETPANSALKAL